MWSLAATRREVRSRRLQSGGSCGLGPAAFEGWLRRICHVQLYFLCDFVGTQCGGEPEGTVDSGSGTGCKNPSPIRHHTLIEGNDPEIAQQVNQSSRITSPPKTRRSR
jgi:hypothetical protein